MKDKDLDRLFRQKLEGLQEEPTPYAWEELNKQLKQKRRGKGWVFLSGIAASLLLFTGLWASLEYSARFIPADPLAQESRDETFPAPKANDRPVSQEPAMITKSGEAEKTKNNTEEEPLSEANDKANTNTEVNEQAEPVRVPKKSAERKAPLKIAEDTALALQAEMPISEGAEVNALPANLVAESVPAEMKIIPEEKSEKIIIRYNSLDQGELENQSFGQTEKDISEEENELSARKIIGFLKKVKSNNSGNLAELREAKDEIFSFRLGRPVSD